MRGRVFGSGLVESGPVRAHGVAREFGIGLFVDERGSTTVAVAVAILVSLSLVFGAMTAQWVTARAADVQAVADAGALAGMNVVAGYVTCAQVLDALVLSMGLVGMLTLAVGMVVSAIPVATAAGPPILDAAKTVFDARARLARTAGKGLRLVEEAVPYLVAVNSLLVIRSNAGEAGSYVGIAVPFPSEGSSMFAELSEDDVSDSVRRTVECGDEIDRLSKEVETAKKRADDALRAGWLADCGGNPCLRERAETLAALSGGDNPDYPTEVGWDFGVAILRARTYYAARIGCEVPLDSTPEELSRSCARTAFYNYALEMVGQSSFVHNEDGTVSCDLRDLPCNTADVRATSLYTDQIWYCTQEPAGRTIHCSPSCPGAIGSSAGFASVAEEESGACVECPTCRFSVVDLGRAPAASTSIDNGFEHWWREVVSASRDYEEAKAELADAERRSKEASEGALGAFEEALSHLKANRVSLQPPGRFGCVCVVADVHGHESPALSAGPFENSAFLPARAAVSAAVLARDSSPGSQTVLGGFFDALVERGGSVGAVGGVLDSIMEAWGGMLDSYGDGYEAFMAQANESFKRLSEIGMGGVSEWLKNALNGVIELTSIEPADLTPKRPVLTNSADVMGKAGNDWYMIIRSYVQCIQSVGPDAGPADIVSALGVFLEAYRGSSKITVAEFEVPGLGAVIPIEVDLGELAEAMKGP